MLFRLLVIALSGAVFGCATGARRFDRDSISPQIERRTGHGIGPGSESGETRVPDGVKLDDGVSEDEAVSIALWNNAAFQEALAELGVRRADLIQAGLLTNPVFSVLFPLGPKQLEFAATFPVEVLWLRPGRVASAELECERVAALLVQGGLELVRDVRVAHAELTVAWQRASCAQEILVLRERIAEFFNTRLGAGAVSELEASTARIEALQAERESKRATHRVHLAQTRLQALLGFGVQDRVLDFRSGAPRPPRLPDSDQELLETAFVSRPDLRAAEIGVESAAERAGLADWEFLVLSAIVDANEEGNEGFEIGPGLQMEVPIFDQNQGGRALADAELERAARRYATVRHGIAGEVAEARARFLEVSAELDAWRQQIVPSLEDARGQAQKAFEAGATSVLPVLQLEVRLVEARLRAGEAEADLRRATAELERSVGRRLDQERKE